MISHMTTEERLAEIRGKEQKATKGPWELHPITQDFYRLLGSKVWNEARIQESGDNAAFIAAMREDVPWLLELVDMQQMTMQELEQELEYARKIGHYYVERSRSRQ